MKIKNIFEKYIFKIRYILDYYLNEYPENKNVSYFRLTDKDIVVLLEKADKRLTEILNKRLNDPSWVVFYYHKNDQIRGYSFLHIPTTNEWNDSLPTKPGYARVSSAFVLPEYRGKGIRGYIFQQQSNYALKKNLKLWSVIESSNLSSLKAARKTGEIKTNNYLIKIYARNVISIISSPLRLYLLLGKKRARR